MDRTKNAAESHETRTEFARFAQLDRTVGRFSNLEMASDLGVSESAVRKWHLKISEVCSGWLKVNGRHTQLSAALLLDYRDRVSQGDMAPDAWVVEMRSQFSEVRTSVEVLPSETAIALRSNDQTASALDRHIASLGAEIAQATAQVDALMDDLAADELALLHAEIEAAQKKGQQKATLLYAAEKQAQNETTQVLRQREIERRQQGAQ